MSGRRIDVHTAIGGYPFRHIPHPDPEILAGVVKREGLDAAWTAHLPSAFWRDPAPGNAELFAALAPHADVLHPVPTIRAGWPGWERELERAIGRRAPAVRVYPHLHGLAGEHESLVALAEQCGAAGLALVLPVRFEDLRQRHRLDTAGDLPAATVRELARLATHARLVVLGAGREWIEEVHWGLTPDEQRRVLYDISWIWGPPEDHLAHLIRTIGADRMCFGTGWPLRLTQSPSANLALLPDDLRPARLADVETFVRQDPA